MSLDTFAYDLLADADVLPQRGTAAFSYDDVRGHLKIWTKASELVAYEPNRIQREFRKRRTGKDIVLKPRQVGLSTEIRGDQFTHCVTASVRCVCIAHDAATTEKLRLMDKAYHDNLPEEIWTRREYDNKEFASYVQTGSQVTYATAGSGNSGRGGTYNYVHGSEVAFWKDAKLIIDGLLQGVPLGGTIVFESTPNGQSGWFYDTFMAAYRGENDWTWHFYAWWWEDGYRIPLEDGETFEFTDDELHLIDMHDLTPEQIKWRRAKQLELKDAFPQEYPEDPIKCFLSQSGSSVFENPDAVAVVTLYETVEEYLRHYPHARLVMGVDWGRDNDYSVFIVMDATRWTVVAIKRMRWIAYTIQRARLKTLAMAWRCERILAEANSMGTVNIEMLIEAGLPVTPFTTTEYSKKAIIDGLATAIEERDIRLPRERRTDPPTDEMVMMSELKAYQQKKRPSGGYSYEGKPHDDCVISLALALYACKLTGTKEAV
jgi:hypothetical protein